MHIENTILHNPGNTKELPLKSRVLGCWYGKSIGGTLGLPSEGRMERQHLTFYDPIPTQAPPNDDLELQLVWLHLVETKEVTPSSLAEAWIRHIHYMWDEYGRCRWNLRRGVPLEEVGRFENPFHAGMGSPIRSEIWACLFPGDPASAAVYAAMDASLDHGLEGCVGEVLFAVMQNLLLIGAPLADAIETALKFIPADSETSRAVQCVRENYLRGLDAWKCYEALIQRFHNPNFTHAPLNVALTLWALWYGGSDFGKSILLAVNAGYDTDCTAATVGATLGLLHGKEGIPHRWIAPIGEEIAVGPGIAGILAPGTLSELTERTLNAVGRLTPQSWDSSLWERLSGPPQCRLEELPGTIGITPGNTCTPVPWANGELPEPVKAAGSASWEWIVSEPLERALFCMAEKGARLYIDDRLVIRCPPGIDYVPAPHRSNKECVVRIRIAPGRYRVRVELDEAGALQSASIILLHINLHLAEWTEKRLPDNATLHPSNQEFTNILIKKDG